VAALILIPVLGGYFGLYAWQRSMGRIVIQHMVGVHEGVHVNDRYYWNVSYYGMPHVYMMSGYVDVGTEKSRQTDYRHTGVRGVVKLWRPAMEAEIGLNRLSNRLLSRGLTIEPRRYICQCRRKAGEAP